MNRIRRVDPRRPHAVTEAGIRRIVLGESIPLSRPALPTEIARKPLRATEAQRCVLAVAHSARGQLDPHARQAVAAAALLAEPDTFVHLLVFGEFDGDAGALGADRLTVITAAPAYAPDVELAILLALIDSERPLHVFLPDNGLPDGDLGRRLAAATGATVAAHVLELSADSVASSYMRGGLRRARQALPRIVLLAPDAIDERLPFVGLGERVPVMPLPMNSAYRDHGTRTLPAMEVGLEEADLIVSAGNGVCDLSGFQALADELGAAVGASRVAVDDGRFSRTQQIGATGKTVSASAYLAFGISGAVQHLQGIKDCRHVIAINLDASAPLVRRADLSIIDDTKRVADALLAEVRQARAAGINREASHG